MFWNRIMMGAIACGAILLSGPLSARAENWELLGEKRVAFIGDRDVIPVGRQEGRFRKLRITVHDNSIHLDRLVVIYGNGEPDVFQTEIKLHRGESRDFDLQGHARSIQRIEMFYRSNLGHLLRGEAHVAVYGDQAGGGHHGGGYGDDRRHEGGYGDDRRHDGDRDRRGDRHGDRDGYGDRREERHGDHRRGGDWELLGSQSVGFHVDRDTIHVGRREGRFSALKIKVHDNTVYFEDLKVVYGNGDVDDIPVRYEIHRGDESRALDLRGGERFIREIHMTYRAQPNFRGRATVEVYGLKE